MKIAATVPAEQLGEWTGYAVDWAGLRMTVVSVRPGPTTPTVIVELAYPADQFAKNTEVELLRTSDVDILATG